MIMISSLDGVWVNWFQAGTGFWECNRVWNLLDIDGIFGKVWENVALFLSFYGFTLWVLHNKVFKEANSRKQLFWHFLAYLMLK